MCTPTYMSVGKRIYKYQKPNNTTQFISASQTVNSNSSKMPGVSTMSNIRIQREPASSTSSTRTYSYSSQTVNDSGDLPHQNSELFNNKSSDIKSSSLVSKAVQGMDNKCLEIVSSPQGWNENQNAPLSYEIVTKDGGAKEFQLKLDAKHFNPEDLKVKFESDTLVISGKHEEKSANGSFSSKSFSRRCTLPPGVNADELNCSLDSSGRMMITAPVRDQLSSTQTRTVTRTSQIEPLLQSGYKIGPGAKEQVVTIFETESNNGPRDGNSSSVTTSTSKSVKTVRTFKTLS